MKFMDYVECLERDGEFAAEVKSLIASEIKWAVERWATEMEAPVDVTEKESISAEEEGFSRWEAMRPKTYHGVWLVLRYMCTFARCTDTDFRAYSQFFELGGEFAAEIMNYMAQELLWIVERWGRERGSTVDAAAERNEEERIAQEESDLQHMVDKLMRRDE